MDRIPITGYASTFLGVCSYCPQPLLESHPKLRGIDIFLQWISSVSKGPGSPENMGPLVAFLVMSTLSLLIQVVFAPPSPLSVNLAGALCILLIFSLTLFIVFLISLSLTFALISMYSFLLHTFDWTFLFSNFLMWKLRLLIWDFLFLIWAINVMNIFSKHFQLLYFYCYSF